MVRDEDARREHDHRRAVACMPTASPSMMFVAWPVCDALEIDFTGLQRVPV